MQFTYARLIGSLTEFLAYQTKVGAPVDKLDETVALENLLTEFNGWDADARQYSDVLLHTLREANDDDMMGDVELRYQDGRFILTDSGSFFCCIVRYGQHFNKDSEVAAWCPERNRIVFADSVFDLATDLLERYLTR